MSIATFINILDATLKTFITTPIIQITNFETKELW
jgi:hypothetical protein